MNCSRKKEAFLTFWAKMERERSERFEKRLRFGIISWYILHSPKAEETPSFSLWKLIFSQTNGLVSTWNLISDLPSTPKSLPYLPIINNPPGLLDCFTESIITPPTPPWKGKCSQRRGNTLKWEVKNTKILLINEQNITHYLNRERNQETPAMKAEGKQVAEQRRSFKTH